MINEKILNQDQLEAVCHGEGPLLIIAGAGTGKTTVITERIKYLILEKNVAASEVLALTFTEKAAKEMEERIDIAMPYGYTQMWISTFHAFCDRILRTEAIHIGLTPGYKLATDSEITLFLRKNLFLFELDYFRPLGNPYKFLNGLIQHFNRLKDEDVSPSEYLGWVKKSKNQLEEEEFKKYSELASAYKIYEELKVKEGVMDFSDLIANTLKLFRSRKSILRYYQDQFKYILVDEFQDTNFAQNTLAILLSGERKNINVVGDDDQAIYRWRGAAISNIIQFKNRFPDAKIITLVKNYRSTSTILLSAYRLIQHNNPDRLEVKENVGKRLLSERTIQGKPVELILSDRVEDEAETVAKKIKQLIKKEKYNYNQIALLLRANDYAQPFIRAFERFSIPYQFLGPGKLFHQDEIKDLIAYLKVLYNFEDSASLYRVLNMPIFKLEGIEVATLLNLARKKNISLFETLEKTEETFLKEKTKEKLKAIANMIKSHLNLVPKETAGQVLYYFLEKSGILKEIIDGKSEKDEQKAKNIAKFFDKLKTFEAGRKDASVFEVVDWIDLAMQMGESPLIDATDWTQNNAVNLLTIHSSKGLEFPVVFILNLVEQRFPTRERKEQIPIPQPLVKEILPVGDYQLQEERRLFYVGMTRAKDLLFLTASSFYGEGKRERKISPFVYEALGKELVEKAVLNKNHANRVEQLTFLEWAPNPQLLPNDQLPTANPITYLSYSQLQTFQVCPLHYKLKYILKIPTPTTAAQSFGTSIHSTLRDLYQKHIRKDGLAIENVAKILQANWISEGYTNKSYEQKAFEKAKKIISSYLKKNDLRSTIPPSALELPFQFFVKNSGHVPLKVGGRIDRVDELGDGRVEILDYKTGNDIPNEKKLAQDLQLTIYALAATEVPNNPLNKKPEEVLLSLYYVEQGLKISTTRTKDQLEEAKNIILQKAQEIAKSDFSCRGGLFCKNCEYKILCQGLK